MEAEGKGGWWNQYSTVPYSPLSVEQVIDRAKDADLDFVVVKAGWPEIQEQFLNAGLKVGTEAYVYPSRPGWEGEQLAKAIADGASFAVINAEVEWEDQDEGPMLRLIEAFRHRKPNTELYASTDTRGNRTHLPYQRVLASHITAWMPMIYPLAFFPRRPAGFIELAFGDCLDSGQRFEGLPILPTIQTYENIGAVAVEYQILDCKRRNLLGYQAYTIGHATDAEWSTFKESELVEEDNMHEDDMSWLDEVIVTYGGDPVEFEILQGDMTTRKGTLTRKQWITYTALGWIVTKHERLGDHTHTIPLTVIS